jgi:hypothetical protein
VESISLTDKTSHPQLWHPLFGRWVPPTCPRKAWQVPFMLQTILPKADFSNNWTLLDYVMGHFISVL